jgi:hypothetical protein
MNRSQRKNKGGKTNDKNKRIRRNKKQLDQGIKEVMTSERFQEWLKFLSDFIHVWSVKYVL